ncbi:MAG: hypothetical protein P1P80_08400 [ANME-2 cluster archaeon]|nr:hypothetical protein [ANME-2 cluster archaeon]
MLKTIFALLILFTIIQPVSALDPFITINVPIADEPTTGLFLNPESPSTTFQLGQNISIFNDDRNRRWFTVVCDRNVFENYTTNEAYMSFRQRTSFQLNEPGTYNFYLDEKPSVTIQITVEGDGTEVTDSDDGIRDISDPASGGLFQGMGELPGPGVFSAFVLLILAFLRLRTRN